MIVKNFMLPRDKCVTVEPDSLLAPLLDKMLETNARSIVVIASDTHDPVGLVTKTDLAVAYKLALDPNTHYVREIMGKKIEKVLVTDTRDAVAKHFEDTKHINAFVFDESDHFVGLVHALDLAIEVSHDSQAWPWNREGIQKKFHLPGSPKSSPRSTAKVAEPPKHTFMDIAGEC